MWIDVIVDALDFRENLLQEICTPHLPGIRKGEFP